MSMDSFLAEYYGTNKTASAPAEDLESQKTVDLFCKLASEQNIDLKNMPDPQVQQLFDGFVERLNAEKTAAAAPAPAAPQAKTASEEEKEKKEHEKKMEEAKKEHEEKHAMAKKAEEADAMGRIMAHAYVHELRKIAADTKVAELPPQFLAHAKGKEEEGKEEKHEPPHDEKKEEKKEEKEEKKASSSALDDLAAAHAYDIVKAAKAAGEPYDPEEAKRKVAAVRELGIAPQTTKTASAPNVEAAIQIRALELLEKAGYPVEWK